MNRAATCFFPARPGSLCSVFYRSEHNRRSGGENHVVARFIAPLSLGGPRRRRASTNGPMNRPATWLLTVRCALELSPGDRRSDLGDLRLADLVDANRPAV